MRPPVGAYRTAFVSRIEIDSAQWERITPHGRSTEHALEGPMYRYGLIVASLAAAVALLACSGEDDRPPGASIGPAFWRGAG